MIKGRNADERGDQETCHSGKKRKNRMKVEERRKRRHRKNKTLVDAVISNLLHPPYPRLITIFRHVGAGDILEVKQIGMHTLQGQHHHDHA
jgi:hypothetical protein